MYTSADNDIDMQPSRVSGWVGFIWFAAVMMILAGIFDIIWGITALVRDEVFVVGATGVVLNIDYHRVGLDQTDPGRRHGHRRLRALRRKGMGIHTGGGGGDAQRGREPARRSVRIPVWSVIVIALDVLVIYAITVHGHELRENQ